VHASRPLLFLSIQYVWYIVSNTNRHVATIMIDMKPWGSITGVFGGFVNAFDQSLYDTQYGVQICTEML